jgi:hypothetical protein
VIGVKVWIFKGEVFDKSQAARATPRRSRPRSRTLAAAAGGDAGGLTPRRDPERFATMMQPKRTKYRKQFKGHNRGSRHRGSTVAFGEFALKATDRGA